MELVNGYVCRDCSDVALAKRNIDPAHPKDGPGQIDARSREPDAPRSPALLQQHLGGTVDVTA
jgi:hypothetical protein